MNQDLRRLVRLQEIMLTLAELAARIEAVPAEVAGLEKDLLAAQDAMGRERTALLDLHKDRRRLEIELQDVEARIAKYQSQLLEVKTNKEYQAMLKEIENVRAERAGLDERILVEMEAGDRRNAEIKTLEETLERKRRATDEGKKRLDAEIQDLRRRVEALEAEQREVTATVPAVLLDPFLKVAKQRKGLALVEVREELCGGCHVRVMPKLIQQVRRAEGLIACDSCKRYLYINDGPGRAVAASGESRAQ